MSKLMANGGRFPTAKEAKEFMRKGLACQTGTRFNDGKYGRRMSVVCGDKAIHPSNPDRKPANVLVMGCALLKQNELMEGETVFAHYAVKKLAKSGKHSYLAVMASDMKHKAKINRLKIANILHSITKYEAQVSIIEEF